LRSSPEDDLWRRISRDSGRYCPKQKGMIESSDRLSLHRRRRIEPISCVIAEYRSRPCIWIAVAFRTCIGIETRVLAVDQYSTAGGPPCLRHISRYVRAAISYHIHIYLIARLVAGIEREGVATNRIRYEDEPRISGIEDVLLDRLIAVRVSFDHCCLTALREGDHAEPRIHGALYVLSPAGSSLNPERIGGHVIGIIRPGLAVYDQVCRLIAIEIELDRNRLDRA